MNIKDILKMVLAALFAALLPASLLFAQDNSIIRALELVEEFHADMHKELKGSAPPVLLLTLKKSSLEHRDKVTSELQSLSWVDRPGPRRHKAVYVLVDDFISTEIDSVSKMKKELHSKDRKKMELTIQRLERTHKEALKKIKGARLTEASKEKRRKPVPIIDSSPYENNPEGKGGGIWER